MEDVYKRQLLICGGGFSSGFMAKSLRESAAKKGLTMDVQARSESMVEDYIEDVDAIMVGPHLSYLMEDISATCEEYGVTPVSYTHLDVYKRQESTEVEET